MQDLIVDINMKHIKLFESFETDDYYTEITNDEYNFFRDSFISMSKSDSYKLKTVISGDYHIEEKELDEPKISYFYCREILPGTKFVKVPNIFTIVKVEDDWFLVYISDHFYKCDQIDGLIKFLKNEGLVK